MTRPQAHVSKGTTAAFVEWLNTFDSISQPVTSLADLSDGIVLFEILAEIDAQWFKQIRSADVGDNWVYRYNNLKKVYKLICRFYDDVLGHPNVEDAISLNLTVIAQDGDEVELVRLCQLVLAIAVQCEKNQTYIAKIQRLSQKSQHSLMLSIEQVMTQLSTSDGKPRSPMAKPISIPPDTADLDKANRQLIEDNAQLRFRFDELEMEKEELKQRLKDMEDAVAQAQQTGKSDFIMRTEIDHLKQDILRSEDKRQESEIVIENQANTIADLRKKLAEMQERADEADRLKDQLEEYRHASEKLQKTENVINKYKKKLEESADLRRQLSNLEEVNRDLLERNQQIEEEYRKLSSFKSNMDTYKEKVTLLEAANAELSQTKARLEHELQHAADQVIVMEETKAKSSEQMQTLMDRLREYEIGDEDQDTQLASQVLSETDPEKLVARIKQLERRNQELQASSDRFTEIERERQELDQKVQRLSRDMDAIRGTTDPTMASASTEQLRLLILDLRRDLERQRENADTTLSGQNANLYKQVVHLQEQQHVLQQKLQKTREFIKEQDRLIRHLQEQQQPDLAQQLASEKRKVHDLLQHSRREQHLMMSAWYDLSQRLARETSQQHLLALRRTHKEKVSWLGQQRKIVVDGRLRV
ncbi:hypothetical protein BZG36_00750 [Bifiguratus adelaidae]|uniref:Calponin-homology (CH) domain-containing protein n=1 Tax=Bifiguratus adelaidae TaxID=1938954 RepID=A0A261Y6W1_9FUNG|nr:hypothetical protein BZG36_00750 [Bifiguratus adelaidae]